MSTDATRCRFFWCLGIGAALALPLAGYGGVPVSPGSAARAAEAIGQPPLPVGQHPRLLFDGRQLGVIRARTKSAEGQGMINRMRGDAFGANYLFLRKLASRDPEWLAEKRQEALNPIAKFSHDLWEAALLYAISGENVDGLVAVELYRVWLSAYPPDAEIKPATSWGNNWAAMAYDWLYEILPPAERERSQKIFGAMVAQPTLDMIGKDWWFAGPSPANRNVTNWTAICSSSLGIVNLAIEGEPGYNPALTPQCIGFLREFLDGGISPDGALYEGLGYASGYGTKDVPYFLAALRRRGINLIGNTHLAAMPQWLSYELLPWGYEGFPLNQSNGALGCGNLLTLVTHEFPGLAKWVFHNATGGLPETLQTDPGMGFLNGLAGYNGERPDKLPLCHWFSTRGLVFSRSGWGERDAAFVLNTNQVGSGHSHADQGSFCLAANGACFFSEGGVSYFDSQFHNVVLIDGLGQAEQQSGVDAFIRSVDSNTYADVTDLDAKLAYDRRLQGEANGPWSWLEFNPVEKADRRTAFVRGASGPLVLVADDIRKDDQERTYAWLGHVPQNNPVTIAGNRFSIKERFGGKVLEARERGLKTTLVARNVRGGTVKGWLLVRSIPHIAGWCSNNIYVNGKLAPYNTMYFGLGFYRHGWSWYPILPENKPDIEFKDGSDVKVLLESASGGRVALAVFSYRKEWEPGDELPVASNDLLVLGADSAEPGEKPWTLLSLPQGALEGAFLGSKAPEVSLKPNPKISTRAIHAVQKSVGARFLTVLAPHDTGDGRALDFSAGGNNQAVEIKSATGLDLVAGAVDSARTAGRVQTDAAAAVVSLAAAAGGAAPAVKGYTLCAGRSLEFDGAVFVDADQGPVQVVNDNRLLLVRGPGGATVRCRRLAAVDLVCNGAPAGKLNAKEEIVTVKIPVLPAEWNVTVSPDGREVTATGNGPLPLRIQAPGACNARINGVDRWFVRDREGNLYPALESGTPFPYANQLTLKELQKCLAPGSAVTLGDLRSFAAQGRMGEVLIADGGQLTFHLSTAGPGIYGIKLQVMAEKPGRLTVTTTNGKTASEALPFELKAGLNRLSLTKLKLRHDKLTLQLAGDGRLGLVSLMLSPEYRFLPANLWLTVGPFASDYLTDKAKDANAAVKQALDTVGKPEKKPKPNAVYTGADGKEMRWERSDSLEGAGMKEGVNLALRCGFKNSRIAYAMTTITVPEARSAQVRISCDYWANLWVNGEKVTSERSPVNVATDGAQFNGTSRTAANIVLRKGANPILVKVQGGSGGSSFSFAITDPGDLQASVPP